MSHGEQRRKKKKVPLEKISGNSASEIPGENAIGITVEITLQEFLTNSLEKSSKQFLDKSLEEMKFQVISGDFPGAPFELVLKLQTMLANVLYLVNMFPNLKN